MFKKDFLTIIVFFTFFVIFTPYLVLAAGEISSGNGGGLPNPLQFDGKEITDPRAVVGNIIKALLGIVGSLALAVFIFGGFMWVTSAGNEEKVKKGKDMLMWAAFGLAVIFASYALVTFVIDALTGGS